MKNGIKLAFIIFFTTAITACSNTEEVVHEQEEMVSEKVLRHVVLFKFKDGAPKEEVQKILVKNYEGVQKKELEVYDKKDSLNKEFVKNAKSLKQSLNADNKVQTQEEKDIEVKYQSQLTEMIKKDNEHSKDVERRRKAATKVFETSLTENATKETETKLDGTPETGESEKATKETGYGGTKKARVRSKKYVSTRARVDKTKKYPVAEAITLIKSLSYSKFDGTITLDGVLRETCKVGTFSLPHSTGKSIKYDVIL